LLSYKESYDLIYREFNNLELQTETVLLEEALGRTLAEDIIADVNLPPFDNSAVDGLAIKYDSNIQEWQISGEVSAGNYSVFEGSDSVLIMTGAKLPPQFDTIIPLEDYSIFDNSAKLNDNVTLKKGMNIRPKASDVSESEIVVQKKVFLTPRNIAAIAACGKSELRVYKKIKIAILATGDELIPINEKPTDDKIRASNNYGLTFAVNDIHQEGINYGFINDDYEATKTKLMELLASDAEIILTTGGVSVGKFDYLKDIYSELGVKEIFWRAYIKPGKPIYFGKYYDGQRVKIIFGLPGNPVSCMVNFDVYIKPNIMMKYGLSEQIRIQAKLLNDIKKRDAKRHFVRASILQENSEYFVTSQLSQSSGNLAGFSKSNCLIELEEDIRNPAKGETVECILI
jgi:molybdopterin molybdotransferase